MKSKKRNIKVPKFELIEIEDYYTYYVMIIGISEDLFWNADMSFLRNVVENKLAYDGWMLYIRERERERINGKKRS